MNLAMIEVILKILEKVLKQTLKNVDIERVMDNIKPKLEKLLKLDFDKTNLDEIVEDLIKDSLLIDKIENKQENNVSNEFIILKSNDCMFYELKTNIKRIRCYEKYTSIETLDGEKYSLDCSYDTFKALNGI